MGWTGHTLIHALFVGLPPDLDSATTFFKGVSGGNSVLLGQALSLLLTAAVVATGVQAGIERLSRWALPLLFVLLIALAIWAAGLDGAEAGRQTFLLDFDRAQLLNLTTIRNAFNQAFFSIGTGIGCILAYAAYLDRRAHLPREAVAVVGMDTAVGLLAGLVTFPVVMSFGLQNTISASTVSTLFVALPTGLASLGTTGRVVAVLFFMLAYLAAITSSVSLLEVPVASLMDRLGWSRRRAVILASVLIFIAGLPAATSESALGFMDSVFGGVLLVLGGLLISLLMGWSASWRFRDDLSRSGTPAPLRHWLLLMLRWVSPVVITIGLVISVVDLMRGWFG